jgi:FecR protein
MSTASFLRTTFGAALLAAAFMFAGPAAAQEIAAIDPNADVTAPMGWRVSGLSGDASARLGSAPFERLVIGEIVPVGSEIKTERGAVVFLSRRGDRIVIQPSTQLRIAEPEAGGLLTQFIQSFGNVFYDVEPRSSRSFGVKGPYMAAVVKGTRFLVTVNQDTNSVRVDEGRVLVQSAAGDSSVMVGAGGVATVERRGDGGIQLSNSTIAIPPATQPPPGLTVGTTATAGSTADADAGSAGNTAGDAAGGAVAGTSNAAGGVVGGAVGAVGGVVGGAVDAVGGVVGGVAETAGEVVGGVTQTAGGLLGGVGKAVGGLLGGGRD